MEKKMAMTVEMLCSELPNEFQTYIQLVQDLGYEEKPNYEFYRKLFRNAYKREGFDKEEPILDWILLKKVSKNGEMFLTRNTSPAYIYRGRRFFCNSHYISTIDFDYE